MKNGWFTGDELLEMAEDCARLAAEATGAPATWCIVIKFSVFPLSYIYPGQKAKLREKLSRGHRVVFIGAISAGKVLVAYCHEGIAASPRGLLKVEEQAAALLP